MGGGIKQVFPRSVKVLKVSGRLENVALSYLHSGNIAVAEMWRMDQRDLGCSDMGLFLS